MPVKRAETQTIDREVTERFLRLKDEILANRQLFKVKSAADFCRNVGMRPPNLHSLQDGVRSITIEQGILLCRNYGFSANYLFLNAGPKFLSEVDYTEGKKLSTRVKEISKQLADKGL